MHSAPAVHYPVAKSLRAGLALAACWCLAAATCLWWWIAGGASAVQAAWAVACLLLGAVVACRQWRDMPVGALRWDGQAWWWQSHEDDMSVTVQVRWDLQHAALLYLKGMPLRRRWALVERRSQPSRWDDLRRALYSPVFASPSGDAAIPLP
jgi:toxin CptA